MQRSQDSKRPSALGESSSEATFEPTHRSRRAFLAAAGAGITASLAGCSALGLGSTSRGDLPEVTYQGRFKRIGLAPAVNDAGIELGAWEEEGLDVSYETASGGQQAASSVASGEAKFGNADIAAVLQLVEEDAPLTIIGNIAGPMDGVVSLEGTPLDDWTDLEGLTVGKFPFGPTGAAAKAAMRREGVDLDTITFQNIQPGNGQRLLLDGSLDAVIRYFPQIKTRLEAQGKSVNVLKTSDVLGHLGVVLYAHDDVIENNPDQANAFVRGWLKAFQLWATDIDRVIELYKPLAVGEFDEELERKTLPALYSSQAPPRDIGEEYGKGWIRAEDVQNTIDAFAETQLLDGDVTVDEAYTNRFIEQNRDLAVETAQALYGALENYDVGPDYL